MRDMTSGTRTFLLLLTIAHAGGLMWALAHGAVLGALACLYVAGMAGWRLYTGNE